MEYKNHYQLHVFEDCVEVFVKQFLGCFKMKKKKKEIETKN